MLITIKNGLSVFMLNPFKYLYYNKKLKYQLYGADNIFSRCSPKLGDCAKIAFKHKPI